ncbi:MAG: hypothetical protein JSR80_07100 [Verrucomicrobia bacterium]|nr:hypothetical protein [Verrucomicrobiota bacterium]
MGRSSFNVIRYEVLPDIKRTIEGINSNLGDTAWEKTQGVARFLIGAASVSAAMYSFRFLADLVAVGTKVIVGVGVGYMLFEVPSPQAMARHRGDPTELRAMIDNWGYYGETPLFALGSGALCAAIAGTVAQLVETYRAGTMFTRGNALFTIGRQMRLPLGITIAKIMTGRCPPLSMRKASPDPEKSEL